MANSLNRNARLQQENYFLSIQQERYTNLCNAIEETRQARHDMRHHLLSIAAFVKEGNQQAAMDYIQAYDHKILDLAPMRCSKNRAVNSVLCAYNAKFQEKRIPLEIHCQVPENISIQDVDMISLLGNLLENALHGCEGCEGTQKAEIFLHEQKKKLIVVCENTCSPALELEGEYP